MRAGVRLHSVLVSGKRARGGEHGRRNDGGQPRGSQELYEQIRAHLGLDKPAGGIFHVAGPSPMGVGA